MSGNAEKLGIFGKHLRFKSEQEQSRHAVLLRALRRRINHEDPAQDMMAQILAAEFLRYSRSLTLDGQVYNSRSPGNSALEAAMQDDDFMDLAHFGPSDGKEWPCQEVSISKGNARQSERKEGIVATGGGDNNQVQLHAKFVSPAGPALRGQAAAERRFYRALREFQKLQRTKMEKPEEE